MPKGKIFFRDMTKAQVVDEVRKIIDPISLRKEFASEFISELIVQKHYFCAPNQLKPIKFRKQPGRNQYELEGYFPSGGWHKVSWRDCIFPQSREKEAVEALRRAVEPLMQNYKTEHPICERCNNRPTEQIDHVQPEFREIVKHAFSLMTANDWEKAFERFDWWDDAPFNLPESCPCLIETLSAHKTAKLQAVCKKCHLENAEERRSA